VSRCTQGCASEGSEYHDREGAVIGWAASARFERFGTVCQVVARADVWPGSTPLSASGRSFSETDPTGCSRQPNRGRYKAYAVWATLKSRPRESKLIGREEAHELFIGRLGDDAVVPSLFAWLKLIETECLPTDTVADEPAEVEEAVEEEVEAEGEPDPPAPATTEDVPEAEPASAKVPQLEGEVVPTTASAEALLTLAEDNVGGIIYLDIRFPADDISAEEDEFFWVPGSWGLEDDESGCREFPEGCGAEYLLKDLGTHTDSGFYWVRGEWRLFGYFSVPVIAGPHQGSFSVNLRAIPIESVPR
jgi:hypothetical protein